LSAQNAVAAGVYSLNECLGAPAVYSRRLTPSTRVRAIVTNSGQANAATGAQGEKDNLEMVEAVAKELGLAKEQVLSASTGVIGVPLDLPKIKGAVPELVNRVSDVAENFALAILTTDLVPKSITTVVQLKGGWTRITGICKGSGMIHPNMATMLGYLLTDVKMSEGQAQMLLQEAVGVSFNMISVDGESSTNDCCFLLANGASGVVLLDDEDYQIFQSALIEVAQFLARSIAADGEGASKLIEVAIQNSPDMQLARHAARGLTMSPLIKTAMHGEDPNWGRIVARLGAERVPAALLAGMELRLQGFTLFAEGHPVTFDREALKQQLKQSQIQIQVDFKAGSHNAVAWGCDLSKKYVDINTEYS
jgi:glutamate N-acetyltransferase/amino-acid N-acetyltransferase